ncbi:MAG: SDR family NAD(P)-dependent oxidoreductase [Cytophagaceae bacterium]|nr:MAG: SDR family NAD(P)-dependent oxidoreductase [Cytophagaceae bacterium]
MQPLAPSPSGGALSVLGGGWLGLPLAQHLAARGYRVQVSRTTAAGAQVVQALGLAAFEINLSAEAALPDGPFWQVPTVLITVPPQPGVAEATQVAQYQQLAKRLRLSGVQHVLYISSTSVYPENNAVVTEATPPAPQKPGGQVVRALEHVLQQEPAFQTTVLRFGGLIGYDRLPANGAAILRRSRAADTPMNVIHRDDCVQIIAEIIRQGAWGEVFNACADAHPTRRDYYAAAAQARGFALPDMGPLQAQPYKVVSSEKLKTALRYSFLYPSPLAVFDEKTPPRP